MRKLVRVQASDAVEVHGNEAGIAGVAQKVQFESWAMLRHSETNHGGSKLYDPVP